MRRRLLAFVIVLILVLLVGGTVALAAVGYQIFSQVQPSCGENSSATPADFSHPNVDTKPYRMPVYEDVRLPSRDRALEISGFWIPADDDPSDNAAVIILHGNAACKCSTESLLPSGMLHRATFNVLAIDMRDVGDSEIEDGRSAGGTEEYLDLLGAWDWLQTTYAIPAEEIGVFGYSLGGSTALIAFGEEAQIAAVWTDSAFADIEDVLDYATRDTPLFSALKPLALFMGRLISGDDITRQKPVEEVRAANNRLIYLVHGTQDNVVPFEQMDKLAEAVRSSGNVVETWETESGHVGSMYEYMTEYEARLTEFFSRALLQSVT